MRPRSRSTGPRVSSRPLLRLQPSEVGSAAPRPLAPSPRPSVPDTRGGPTPAAHGSLTLTKKSVA